VKENREKGKSTEIGKENLMRASGGRAGESSNLQKKHMVTGNWRKRIVCFIASPVPTKNPLDCRGGFDHTGRSGKWEGKN